MVARWSAPGDGQAALNTAWRGRVIAVSRVAVALVFCYAGWIKMQTPQAFADSIATFQLLPARLSNLLALGLPPFELVVGILLLSGWKARLAAFCGLMATGVFLLALGSAIIRGLPVECGCFGDAPSSLAPAQRIWLAIGRDVLLAVALTVVHLHARRRS